MFHLKKASPTTYEVVSSNDLEESNRVGEGEFVSCHRARNVAFHRKYFALIKMMFENQDEYKKGQEDLFRKLMQISAGYYDQATDKDGHVHYIPKSISFEAMSQSEFESLFDAMLDVAAVKLQTAPDLVRAELINFM